MVNVRCSQMISRLNISADAMNLSTATMGKMSFINLECMLSKVCSFLGAPPSF